MIRFLGVTPIAYPRDPPCKARGHVVFKDRIQYWGPVPCVPALSQRGFIAVAQDQEHPSVKEFRIPACGRLRL